MIFLDQVEQRVDSFYEREAAKVNKEIQKLIASCQKKNKRKIKLCGINGEHWWEIEGKDSSGYSEAISFLALDWLKKGPGYEPQYELFPVGEDGSMRAYRMARVAFNQFYQLVQVHYLIYKLEEILRYSLFGTITADEIKEY